MGWDNANILDAVSLISLKFHNVQTATRSTEGGSQEAAAPVRHHIAPAGEHCQKDGRSIK